MTQTVDPALELTRAPASGADAELEALRLEVAQLRYALTSRATIEPVMAGGPSGSKVGLHAAAATTNEKRMGMRMGVIE